MNLIAVGDNVADWYIEQDTMYPGGNAFNVAVMTRRLEMDTAYLGTIGNDRAGTGMLETLQREHVQSDRVRIADGPNWVGRVILRENDRVFLGSDRGVYTPLTLDDDDIEYIKRFDVLHTSIFSEIESYLPRIDATGITVSFDYSNRYDSDYIARTAPYVRIAFVSTDIADHDEVRDHLRAIQSNGPECVIATMGVNGSIGLVDGDFHFQEALPINVVDTMGAGDSFIAGFLRRYRTSDSMREKMRFAAEVAAKNCLISGSLGCAL